MFGSAIVYLGLIMVTGGLVLIVKPIRRLRITTRWRGLGVAGVGLLLAGIGLLLPVSESRVTQIETRLDEFTPAWQFHELHSIRVAARPERVFEAIKLVRPDEILLFRTLIAIRAGGQPHSQSVQSAAGTYESLIDIATNTSFVVLADDPPREFVMGTVVGAPPGPRAPSTPELFQKPLPAGFALATMNFLVTPDGSGGSVVSTETRVYVNSPSARRQFAAYWRVIYPGSAMIRRTWLRAIRRRATSVDAP